MDYNFFPYLHSGSKFFQFYTSLDNENWTKVVVGLMQNLHGVKCNKQENQVFTFRKTEARYFKFEVRHHESSKIMEKCKY